MTSEFDGTEAWAVWNNCNGVFEVTMWRADAQKLIADGEYPECDVIPVTIVECPQDQHIDRNHDEDIRERDWGHCCEAIRARSQKPTAHEEKAREIACGFTDALLAIPSCCKDGKHTTFCNDLSSAIATALRQAAEAEREACAMCVQKLADNSQELKLRLGEMTAQEMRTLYAGLSLSVHLIKARSQIEKPALAGADASPPAQSLPDTPKD